MFDFYIPPETILNIELTSGYVCMASALIWIIYKSLPIKFIFYVSTIAVLFVGTFRDYAYNSDTKNYASYFFSYSLERQLTLFGLSKLEPLHIVLMYFSKSFNAWLSLEAILSAALLTLVYFKDKRTISFLILSALVLTLNTSSMRFSMSCIVLSYLLLSNGGRLVDLIRITLLSASTHGVMLVSGAFASRKTWVPIAFSGAFFIAAIYISAIGQRVTVDTAELKSIGLKSFLILILIMIHWKFVNKEYKISNFLQDIVGFTTIFILTALRFPTMNRIMIIALLCILFSKEYKDVSSLQFFSRFIYAVVLLLIIGPYVLFTPDLFYSGRW